MITAKPLYLNYRFCFLSVEIYESSLYSTIAVGKSQIYLLILAELKEKDDRR